ncbi:MAG: hypothetical protein OEZ04_06610 [Nitrospinota bacterium]|nr:hypothetical protein [Nitrospinota bacterium]
MNSSLVAVVSYEDIEFRESLSSFLAVQFQIEPVHFDILTIATLKRKNLDVYLINSDAMGGNKKFARNFQSVVTSANNGHRKSIIMLTRKLLASDFLHNLELTAVDTIDIGGGMDSLTVPLSRHLLERQLALFEKGEENGPRNMLK